MTVLALVQSKVASTIKHPNLPQGTVRTVLVSEEAGAEIISGIIKLGLEPVLIPPCDDLPLPVRAHPDLLLNHIGGNQIVVYHKIADKIAPQLKNKGFQVILSENRLRPVYPYDCALDAAAIGNFVIVNRAFTDGKLLRYYENKRLSLVNVRQGYAKCSALILNESSLITSDPSIYAAAVRHSINALKIREGFISLPGYQYGFIGGCSGKISKNKICVTGDLRGHPDYINIMSFMEKQQIELICLAAGAPKDIGGIIPITEDVS